MATSTAELAHGEKSHNQSLTHPAYLMCRESKLSIQNRVGFNILLDIIQVISETIFPANHLAGNQNPNTKS